MYLQGFGYTTTSPKKCWTFYFQRRNTFIDRGPLDPWFDQECYDATRLTRHLLRASAAASRRAAECSVATSDHSVSSAVFEVAAAETARYCQRRLFHKLRRWNCSDYRIHCINDDRYDPYSPWRTIDELLWRGLVMHQPLWTLVLISFSSTSRRRRFTTV